MVLKRVFFLFLCIWSVTLCGQTNIKAMFYNTLNYNSDTESKNRTPHLKTILESVQPDLFMVCELKNEAASNYLFDNAVLPYKTSFKKAPFKYSQSPATSLLQMVYYNSKKLILESSSVIPTGTRDINHYTFKINTENADTNPIKIEVFVTHLKASRGIENRLKRNASVLSFVRELDRLPLNSNILFAGDFNFYTSNEEGFSNLIDKNNSIKIVDPINQLCPKFPDDGKDYFDANYNSTYFWNNSSFANVHSQSTRTFTLTDGAGGGMDDRFDFIMMSENLQTNTNLFYKADSYKAVGNNGNCYNSFVSNTNCSGEFSQNLRNALHQFSDHLPIVMELETPQNTLSIEENSTFVFLSSNIVSANLKINTTLLAHKKIAIFNHLGQIVKEHFVRNEKELSLDVRFLPKGVYSLKSASYKSKKFLKI